MRSQPRVEMRAVVSAPGDVPLHRDERIAVLQVRPHRRDQRVEPVLAADLGHSLDHAAAQALAAEVGRDQDLQRAEDGRRRRSFGEGGFDDGVDSAVGQARDVSVPARGDRVPHADDLLALVVPGVELELGVLLDHAAEEPFRTASWYMNSGQAPSMPAACGCEPGRSARVGK